MKGAKKNTQIEKLMYIYTVIAEHLLSYVHTKTASDISSLTAIDRVPNFTRIEYNKSQDLFVSCKIPCSGTDVN